MTFHSSNRKKLSLWKLLTSDYLSFMCLSVPLGLIVCVAGFSFLIQNTVGNFLIFVSVALFILSLPAVAWRLKSFNDFFQRCTSTTGRITSNVTYKGRDNPQLKFAYQFADQSYESTTTIPPRRRLEFPVGSSVEVLLDPQSPKRAYLARLFR